MDRVIKKQNPTMFDKAFGYIQDALSSELLWLNHIFPQAERLVKNINGKRVYSPNVYIGDNEYELITPDAQGIGNYSFFLLDEPQRIEYEDGSRIHATAPFSLVVWFDIRTVFNDDTRDMERAKRDVLRAVRHTWMRHGRFHIDRIYQRAENVFKEFTLDEIDNQYLMQPYGGFRLYGEISIIEECETI